MELSLEKRSRAAEIVVDQTNGRIPIVLHVGTPDTEMTIQLAKHAKGLGVDAIAAVGPFFYKPDSLGLIQHYKRIGEAAELPLFIYNNVGRQGYNIGPETFEKIAKEAPQIAGLKDSSYNIEQLQDYVFRFGKDYTIMGFGDSLIFVTFAVGASAHISVVSNIFPELAVQLYEAARKGDYKRAGELQLRLNDRISVLKRGPYITPYKEALKFLRGIDMGTVSSPLRPMTDEELTALEQDLRKLGSLQ